ncbi:MAG TPA: ATP-binding protein [Rubrivivax sp.]|nr:ATP-binding protein [Rubrivivax sp.]
MDAEKPAIGTEHRRTERRQGGDRRRAPREPVITRPADESWFGVLGVAADTQLRDDEAAAGGESAFDTGWAGAAAAEQRVLSRQARRILGEPESALTRIYRTYATARALIGAAMVAGVGVSGLMGGNPSVALGLLCLAYALQSITLWLLPRFGALTPPRPQDGAAQRRRQWLATIGVDLAAFTALHLLISNGSLNFAALLVLPVLMSGVLSSRLISLATAAGVALMLLVVAWYAAGSDSGSAVLITQSGLAGIGFFAIALLAGELAGRLAREEVAARGSMELARQQAQLNRLVIEEMADGVLVVDRKLRVRATNPAARSLLSARGTGPAAPFQLQARLEWSALCEAVQRALAEAYWPEAGSDVVLSFGTGDTRTLRMRVRFTRRRSLQRGQAATEEFCVLLLEDVRTAQARLRQEKLAAMGRVSVGIAHEIRNPLSAIAQANALLMEDALPEAQQRLLRMVADNVARLKRLVDEVMETAPGAAPLAGAIDATAAVADAAAEWARSNAPDTGAGGSSGRLRLDLPAAPLRVMFDAEHLRRVLVNLLDNARRHASGAPDAIGIRLAARDEGAALLIIDSDGPPIAPEVERHLFEPFFSTRSRGTGLGLYICRELCERYGASIEYRLRPDGLRNLFLVTMRREPALSAASRAKAPA